MLSRMFFIEPATNMFNFPYIVDSKLILAAIDRKRFPRSGKAQTAPRFVALRIAAIKSSERTETLESPMERTTRLLRFQ